MAKQNRIKILVGHHWVNLPRNMLLANAKDELGFKIHKTTQLLRSLCFRRIVLLTLAYLGDRKDFAMLQKLILGDIFVRLRQ